MRSQFKKRNGYTLIEILIAATIFVMVVGVGIATYSSASGFQSKSSVIRETNQGARFAFDSIVKDIRGADAMNIGGAPADPSGNTVLLNGFAFTGSTNYEQPESINPAAPGLIHNIAIFKKGMGVCAAYDQEIIYYAGERGGAGSKHWTIYQQVKYVDPVNYSNTITTPGCENGPSYVSPSDFLPSTVELLDNGSGNLAVSGYSISGMDPRSAAGIGPNSAASVKLNMSFKPANSESNNISERRVIALQTTVVPRFIDY